MGGMQKNPLKTGGTVDGSEIPRPTTWDVWNMKPCINKGHKRPTTYQLVSRISSINSIWLVVSTNLKNSSKNGNLPQVGVKIKNIWVATTQVFSDSICFLTAKKSRKNNLILGGMQTQCRCTARGTDEPWSPQRLFHWKAGDVRTEDCKVQGLFVWIGFL